MEKGFIALVCFVLLTVNAGAEIVTTYEIEGNNAKITTIRTDVEFCSLEELLRKKARNIRNVENYTEQKVNCDAEIAKKNAENAEYDVLISQLVP